MSFLIALTGLLMQTSNASVTIVNELPTESPNRHYVGNREPLERNAMVKLPVASVKARGWLEEYLKRQRSGMTGRLREVSAWLEKDGNAWLSPSGEGEWGWEEVPYWLKGYIVLAYQLEDKAMIAEANVWIEGALNSQRENGDFGPDLRLQDGTRDFWANMLMLNCLQSHYEFTGDERVIKLMTKYFRYQLALPDKEYLTGYWQHMRGGDNMSSIYWLYNRTGDAFLLELATKTHRRTANWMMEDTLPNWHNVNVAQSFDEPAIYYQQTKDKKYLQAAYSNFDVMRNLYGDVPGGMFGADENARPGRRDPRQATETCGFVEQMYSDEELLRITGDISWADHCEDVAFNSYPASVMPDFRALRYLTSPNMISSDAENHAPGVENAGPFFMMNPLSNRCCQHNHSHGWPFFTDHLWMASNDNGLVAAMYSASQVKAKVGSGATATITEDSHYPFEETLRFKVELDRASEAFPLYLRVPAWCAKPGLKINGESQTTPSETGAYLKIDRTWKSGDTVELTLPMDLSVQVWKANKDSVSINHGPLTYSLKIGEKVTETDSTKSAVWDAKWTGKVKPELWPAFEIQATTPWNYALAASPEDLLKTLKVERKPWPKSNFPFTVEDAPIQITTTAKRLPEWQKDRFGLAAELQQSPAKSSEKTETITLIPMGAARLRISAFPWVAENGAQWEAPPMPHPYAPKASHVWGGDDVWAVCDKIEPKSSGDKEIPRLTFWPHKGTEEWVEYTFEKPITFKAFQVYWFDDTGNGDCRVPKSWTIEGKVDGEWRRLKTEREPGVLKDTYNDVAVENVDVQAVRIRIQLQEGYSAGILEWKIPPQWVK